MVRMSQGTTRRPSVGVGKLALSSIESRFARTSQQAEVNPPGRQLKVASSVQQY